MPAGRRPSSTQSLKTFKKNINRANAFIRIFVGPDGRVPGQPSNDEKELLRGAVVFAVGALDAYLHDLVIEIVPKHGASSTLREGLKSIAKTDPGLALRVALAKTSAEAVDTFGEALGQWLDNTSFHGSEAVVRALRYLDIAVDQFQDLSDFDDAADWLNEGTEHRHKMVHRGGSPTISKSYAQDFVDIVEDIGKHVDTLVVAKYLR